MFNVIYTAAAIAIVVLIAAAVATLRERK